jgi:inhibitor of KinA sporulation pathway (predicted exonuclease)
MKTPSTIQAALYLDLELNCAERFRPGDPDPEIIEIGIVQLDIASLRIVRERDYLVRPHSDISRRCTKITGLTNADFKGSKPFTEVIATIGSEWPSGATSFAWGEDGPTLTRACRQHRVRMPFRRSIDLSQIVRQALLFENQLSLRTALELLGLEFDGCAHMALADARNTTRLHAEIIRRLRVPGANPASGPEVTNPPQPTWFGQLLANTLKTVSAASAPRILAPTKMQGFCAPEKRKLLLADLRLQLAELVGGPCTCE